jgi:hypothetical protein
MEFRTDRLIYTAILLFFCTTLFAQPYRNLTVDDFKGPRTAENAGDIAYTNCTIEFSYIAKKEKNYYALTFTVRLIMNDDQSWMDMNRITSKEMMAEILKHEQGHYNIAYMEQQEILRTVARTVFYANYASVATNIFNTIDAKYRQLNLDYDADTQNSTNRVQQRSWDAYFQKRLAYMPPVKG